MITQYDAIAEIEAMKVTRSGRARMAPVRGTVSVSSPSVWAAASEHAIRSEMERRLAQRASRVSGKVAAAIG